MFLKRALSLACLWCLLFILGGAVAVQAVTLRLALRTGQAGVDVYEKLVTEFEQANPGIDVEIENTTPAKFYEKILLQVASGVSPDVLYVHYLDFPNMVKRNILLDLEKFIKRDNYPMDDFYPPTIAQLTYEGKSSYALPRETSSAAVFYNMDHFDGAGVNYPDKTWTYDSLITLAKKLTRDENGDGKIDRFGIRAPWGWNHRPTILWSFGGRYFNENGEFAMQEPEGVQAMQWVADLVYKHNISTIAWGDRFVSGKSSIEFMNYWHVQENLKANFRWDTVLTPLGPKGRVVRTATGAHAILRDSKYPEESWKLMKFLSTTASLLAQAQEGTIIPARRSSVMSRDFIGGHPANKVFVEGIQYGKPDTLPQEVSDALDKALDPVWKGLSPATKALEEVRPVINQIMRDLKSK